MRPASRPVVALGLLTTTLVVGLLAGLALAQTQPGTAPPPVTPPTMSPVTPAGEGAGAWLTIGMVVGLLVLVGGAGKLLDLRRKRQAEAVHLQAQVSDALLREQALFGLPVTPTAHVPTWRGSPATLEISGEVPTPEIRDAILRLAEHEAMRIRPDVRIEDKLSVIPSRVARVA